MHYRGQFSTKYYRYSGKTVVRLYEPAVKKVNTK